MICFTKLARQSNLGRSTGRVSLYAISRIRKSLELLLLQSHLSDVRHEKTAVKKQLDKAQRLEGRDAALRRPDGAARRPYHAFIPNDPRLDTRRD